MIDVAAVSQRLGRALLLDDVSLSAAGPGRLALVSADGASRSLLRVLAGVLAPDAGTVRVEGVDMNREPLRYRRRVGYGGAGTRTIRSERELGLLAAYRGLGGGAVGEALRSVGYDEAWDDDRSRRRQLGLAAAALGSPPVLLLEDPVAGLEPSRRHRIAEVISGLARRHLVVSTLTELSGAADLADRLVLLDGGRVIASGPPADLEDHLAGVRSFRVLVDGAPPEMVTAALLEIVGVSRVEPIRLGAARLSVESLAGIDLRAGIFDLVVGRGWRLLELQEERSSLGGFLRRLEAPPAGFA